MGQERRPHPAPVREPPQVTGAGDGLGEGVAATCLHRAREQVSLSSLAEEGTVGHSVRASMEAP